MRQRSKFIRRAVACLSVAVVAGAAAPPPQTATPGEFIDWSRKDGPKTIAIGDTKATISAAPCDDGGDVGEDCYRASVAVTSGDRPPVTLQGEPGIAYRVAIGRLNAADPGASVMLDSFTGGAHCCDVFAIAEPAGDAMRIVPVSWQSPGSDGGDPQTMFDTGSIPFPADLSGDGHADIVLRDDRFLYEFASYAGSMAPPVVLSVIDGKTVDRSADPAFAPLFADAMRQAKTYCAATKYERNGACAAYVADAARTGQLDAAWRFMLANYDRKSIAGLTRCTTAYVGDSCPHEEHFADYPAALRAFLIRTGYIAG